MKERHTAGFLFLHFVDLSVKPNQIHNKRTKDKLQAQFPSVSEVSVNI
jgi:hypothetical protein